MRIRFRVLLPLCNAAIDVLLLMAAAYAVNADRVRFKHQPALWDQRYRQVDRKFLLYADGPAMAAPVQAVSVGTLPATIATALIAELLFANGALSWRVSSPFDLRLVGLNLCIAAVFWYALGRSMETKRALWRKGLGGT